MSSYRSQESGSSENVEGSDDSSSNTEGTTTTTTNDTTTDNTTTVEDTSSFQSTLSPYDIQSINIPYIYISQ